ncbi:hypothetical protein SISSUDRAFT_1124386 [Sistotremastrum suecicum HHB10207 ss-3]|uniref:Uncharacterized protein n=1 Tax=Sistotremastrum suecicum HHB10207 ss-3 TaxID=1314776 RepID=A0A166J0Z0_9AGAM|nr:hypothetical protein SISSUDRAFT_1124386 [Sistotremastrum suecicum HHB10207 ss-3]
MDFDLAKSSQASVKDTIASTPFSSLPLKFRRKEFIQKAYKEQQLAGSSSATVTVAHKKEAPPTLHQTVSSAAPQTFGEPLRPSPANFSLSSYRVIRQQSPDHSDDEQTNLKDYLADLSHKDVAHLPLRFRRSAMMQNRRKGQYDTQMEEDDMAEHNDSGMSRTDGKNLIKFDTLADDFNSLRVSSKTVSDMGTRNVGAQGYSRAAERSLSSPGTSDSPIEALEQSRPKRSEVVNNSRYEMGSVERKIRGLPKKRMSSPTSGSSTNNWKPTGISPMTP